MEGSFYARAHHTIGTADDDASHKERSKVIVLVIANARSVVSVHLCTAWSPTDRWLAFQGVLEQSDGKDLGFFILMEKVNQTTQTHVCTPKRRPIFKTHVCTPKREQGFSFFCFSRCAKICAQKTTPNLSS